MNVGAGGPPALSPQAWPQAPSWVTVCGAPSDPGPSSETAAAVTAFLVCCPRKAPAFQPMSQPGDVSNCSLVSTVKRKYLKRLVVVLKAPAIMSIRVQTFCVHLHLVSFLFFLLAVLGLVVQVFFSSCGERGLLSTWGGRACHCGRFSCCGIPSRAQYRLEHTLSSCDLGLVAPLHVGFSQIRNRTCVSCIGRQILYH